jgi:hypothetical protein
MPRLLSRARRRSLVAAVLAVVGVVPAVTLVTASSSGAVTSRTPTQTPVMGPSLLSAAQLSAWYHARHSGTAQIPALHNNVQALAQIFIDEGTAQGVRGDIAFAQSMLETGWLGFAGSQIPPSFNNYSGLFAFNNRPKGTTCAAETSPSRCFATPNIGVRYQIQLLRGYADASTVNLPMLIRPPSDRIGIAPYWERFGGSQTPIVWATAPNYGNYVLGLYADALSYSGFSLTCLPYYTGGAGRTAGSGYWVVTRSGAAFNFGTAPDLGDVSHLNLRGAIVSAEATPDHKGYWMLGYDGGIFSFGSARFYGSLGNVQLWKPVNDFATTPNGRGYWLAASDGGVFTFGNAGFHGSAAAPNRSVPIIGLEATRSGQGYWMLRADGALYTFGDAVDYGTHGTRLKMVDIKRTPSGKGYYELRSDGGVHAFGDAQFYGDAHACGVSAASHMIVTPTGKGYWIVTTTGVVLSFGDAKPLGMPPTSKTGVAGFALQG